MKKYALIIISSLLLSGCNSSDSDNFMLPIMVSGNCSSPADLTTKAETYNDNQLISSTSYSYNSRLQLTSQQTRYADNETDQTLFFYDADGRLAVKELYSQGLIVKQTTYDYDQEGRLSQEKIYTRQQWLQPSAYRYRYNQAGQLETRDYYVDAATSIAIPANYSYDDQGRLTAISSSGYNSSYSYKHGRQTITHQRRGQSEPLSVTTKMFDNYGHLLSEELDDALLSGGSVDGTCDSVTDYFLSSPDTISPVADQPSAAMLVRDGNLDGTWELFHSANYYSVVLRSADGQLNLTAIDAERRIVDSVELRSISGNLLLIDAGSPIGLTFNGGSFSNGSSSLRKISADTSVNP